MQREAVIFSGPIRPIDTSGRSRSVSLIGKFARGAVPQLLISVGNVCEARAALAGGADIIDLKEPHAGSLGAVSRDVARRVATMMLRRSITTNDMDGSRSVPLSLAMGELQHGATPLSAAPSAEETAAFQIFSYAKTGLAGCGADLDWQRRWNGWRAKLPCEMEGDFTTFHIHADIFFVRPTFTPVCGTFTKIHHSIGIWISDGCHHAT